MDETEKPLKLCQEKLNIRKTQLGANHPCVAQILMIMADLLKRKRPTESLKYYEEALAILEVASPPDNQTTFTCLTDMSRLYNEHDMNKDAIRCELKALNLYRRTLSSDHTDIANSLRNLGFYYEKMNTTSEAFRHYTRSLSIYRTNYGTEHRDVKKLEEDIARLMSKRTSLDLVEPDLSSFIEESSFMLDSSFTQATLSTTDFTYESKPAIEIAKNSRNSKHLLSAFKSKSCVIL
jgi:tetratricopeptide (TPR) repeat protein